MVGNKLDLQDERKISQKEASELAAQYDMKYFESSAKTNIGVAAFFETLMTDLYNRLFNMEPERTTFTLEPGAGPETTDATAQNKKKKCSDCC